MKKENNEKKYSKEELKEKLDLYKKGIVSGSAVASLGGVSYGLSRLAERMRELNDKVVETAGKTKPKFPADSVMKLKKAAPYLTASGLALAGYSKYKHHKLKKIESDDNTEK